MLTAFVIAQVVFDVAIVALGAVYLLTRARAVAAPAVAPPPPDWYPQMVTLAQDLMAATEPVIDRLESTAPAPAVVDPYAQARALLETGTPADEVAARAGVHPGEVRLLASVLAAGRRHAGRSA
ncbi:MAG TPA: hypothetical protein VEA38_26160 [Terriglobales bacterium]|nr:hypothetical protein [Terriglobales bacterium]